MQKLGACFKKKNYKQHATRDQLNSQVSISDLYMLTFSNQRLQAIVSHVIPQ